MAHNAAFSAMPANAFRAVAVCAANVWRHCFDGSSPRCEMLGPQPLRRSDQADAVIHANGACRFRDGIDTGAGIERTHDVDPVVPERLKDPGVAGKVLLGQARHHTTRVGQGHSDPHVVADGERAPHPLVLDEPALGGVDDHVHAEPARVEAALRLELAELLEAGRREHAEREEVEERPFRDGGR